jgi:hypothetical protein
MNNAERIKTVFLKTLIIDNECFSRFEKLILEGPKYLSPRMDGIDILFFSTLVNAPEKLFQVAFSLTNFSTVDFERQVKLPNLIE